MAFDVPEAFACDEELMPGCFLGLLHEGMEHGDHPATHGLGVRKPELGTVIFKEVEQRIASRQQIHGPVLNVIAHTNAEYSTRNDRSMLARVLRAHGAHPPMGSGRQAVAG